MSKTVMELLFFYEIDNQECWVSGSVRDIEVGKIHGILGVAGQGSRVSGDLSEKMSATYQGWWVPEMMYIWHFEEVDYRMSCPNSTSKVTSISWYVQSGRSTRLSIRLGLVKIWIQAEWVTQKKMVLKIWKDWFLITCRLLKRWFWRMK